MSQIKYIVGPRGAIMLPGGRGLRLPGQEVRFEDFTSQEQWLEHQRQQNIIPEGMKILLEGSGVALGNPEKEPLKDGFIQSSVPKRDLAAELEAFKARQAAAGIDVEAERAREEAEAKAREAAEKPAPKKRGRPKKVKPTIEIISQTDVVEESEDLLVDPDLDDPDLDDPDLDEPFLDEPFLDGDEL